MSQDGAALIEPCTAPPVCGLPVIWRGKIDDRESAGETLVSRRTPNIHAGRRRQCAAWYQPDLGFTKADCVENIRRVAEIAKSMVDAGLIVIVSFISPFRAEREFARSLFEPGEFYEIFVDTPFAVCQQRDPKQLYAMARRGELKKFTGIDRPYEWPDAPDFRLDTASTTPEGCVRQILASLKLSGG